MASVLILTLKPLNKEGVSFPPPLNPKQIPSKTLKEEEDKLCCNALVHGTAVCKLLPLLQCTCFPAVACTGNHHHHHRRRRRRHHPFCIKRKKEMELLVEQQPQLKQKGVVLQWSS